MTGLEAFAWGLLGGVGAELLGWYKLRSIPTSELPVHLRSRLYWIVTSLMAVTGGLIALAYFRSGVGLHAILAINVGAATPLLLERFIGTGPRPDLGRID